MSKKKVTNKKICPTDNMCATINEVEKRERGERERGESGEEQEFFKGKRKTKKIGTDS